VEARLIKKEDLLDQRQIDIDKEVENIKKKIAEIKEIREKTDKIEEEKLTELQKIGNLSVEEAKEQILKSTEKKYEEDILSRIQKLEMFGAEKYEAKAKEIITTAIQRMGNSVASDVMSTIVNIPSDEMKGKIIARKVRISKLLNAPPAWKSWWMILQRRHYLLF